MLACYHHRNYHQLNEMMGIRLGIVQWVANHYIGECQITVTESPITMGRLQFGSNSQRIDVPNTSTVTKLFSPSGVENTSLYSSLKTIGSPYSHYSSSLLLVKSSVAARTSLQHGIHTYRSDGTTGNVQLIVRFPSTVSHNNVRGSTSLLLSTFSGNSPWKCVRSGHPAPESLPRHERRKHHKRYPLSPSSATYPQIAPPKTGTVNGKYIFLLTVNLCHEYVQTAIFCFLRKCGKCTGILCQSTA